MKNKVEYILCAAIHYKDDNIYLYQPKNIESGYVVSGRRHHNCFMTRKILASGFSKTNAVLPYIESTQGFITSEDRFVNRAEAYELAIKSGQIQDNGASKILVSEDLY